jgi:hypothetical protein
LNTSELQQDFDYQALGKNPECLNANKLQQNPQNLSGGRPAAILVVTT